MYSKESIDRLQFLRDRVLSVFHALGFEHLSKRKIILCTIHLCGVHYVGPPLFLYSCIRCNVSLFTYSRVECRCLGSNWSRKRTNRLLHESRAGYVTHVFKVDNRDRDFWGWTCSRQGTAQEEIFKGQIHYDGDCEILVRQTDTFLREICSS